MCRARSPRHLRPRPWSSAVVLGQCQERKTRAKGGSKVLEQVCRKGIRPGNSREPLELDCVDAGTDQQTLLIRRACGKSTASVQCQVWNHRHTSLTVQYSVLVHCIDRERTSGPGGSKVILKMHRIPIPKQPPSSRRIALPKIPVVDREPGCSSSWRRA